MLLKNGGPTVSFSTAVQSPSPVAMVKTFASLTTPPSAVTPRLGDTKGIIQKYVLYIWLWPHTFRRLFLLLLLFLTHSLLPPPSYPGPKRWQGGMLFQTNESPTTEHC